MQADPLDAPAGRALAAWDVDLPDCLDGAPEQAAVIVEGLRLGLRPIPGQRLDVAQRRAWADVETVTMVATALQYAQELPESVLVDAAAAAARVSRAALVWQARLTQSLAHRRSDAAAREAFETGIDDDAQACAQTELAQTELTAAEQERFDIESRGLAWRSAVAECAIASGTTESVLAGQVAFLDAHAGTDATADPARVRAVVRAAELGTVDLPRAQAIADAILPLTDSSVAARIERTGLAAAERGLPLPKLRSLLHELVAARAPDDLSEITTAERLLRTGVKVRRRGHGLATMTITADADQIEQARAALTGLTEVGQGNSAQTALDAITNATDALEVLLTATDTATPTDAATVTSTDDDAEADAEDEAEAQDGAGPVQHCSCGGRWRSRVRINVTVPLSTLLGGDVAAELGGCGMIPAALARQIVADNGAHATWRCHHWDDRPDHSTEQHRAESHRAESPSHGSVIGVGRAVHDPGYAPSPSTREYVIARDRTCRFPGCNRATDAPGTDIDHVLPWQGERGGSTCSENLIALCRHHHRLKTHSGFRPRHEGNHLVWTTPTGRQVRTAWMPTSAEARGEPLGTVDPLGTTGRPPPF